MVHLFSSSLGFNAYIPSSLKGITVSHLKKIFHLSDSRALNQILKKSQKAKPGLDTKSLPNTIFNNIHLFNDIYSFNIKRYRNRQFLAIHIVNWH